MTQQRKTAAQNREEIFKGFFALATVFGAAGVAAVPVHEPTAMVLIGLCSLSLAGGCAMGAIEMGIESAKFMKVKAAVRKRSRSRE